MKYASLLDFKNSFWHSPSHWFVWLIGGYWRASAGILFIEQGMNIKFAKEKAASLTKEEWEVFYSVWLTKNNDKLRPPFNPVLFLIKAAIQGVTEITFLYACVALAAVFIGKDTFAPHQVVMIIICTFPFLAFITHCFNKLFWK